MTPKQTNIMRAFGQSNYYGLSASEAGDPEIQVLFTSGFVERYSVSGGSIWHLTDKGRAYNAEHGFFESVSPVRAAS
jgi:hypothetical protein